MKKNLSILFLILFMASTLQAKGIFISPGERAGSMGGAFTGVADDLTAIYWNPAGLALQSGNAAQASLFYSAPTAESNVSLKNALKPDIEDGDFPIPNFYGLRNIYSGGVVPNLEPESYDSKEVETSALMPFVAGGTQINGISLAAGFYISGGGGGLFEDKIDAVNEGDSIEAKAEAQYGFLVGNLSAAKALNQQLSVGLGINYIYMQDDVEVNKSFNAGETTQDRGMSDYDVSIEESATGSGIELSAGLMYELVESFNIGAVFRSGASIELSGTGEYEPSGLDDLEVESHKTDYTEDYIYPMTYGLGASYKATDALMLAGGVDMQRYSNWESNVEYDDELDDVFENKDGDDLKWDDVYILRLGAEYMLNENLSAQGGVFYESVGAPRDDLTLLNTNQYSMTGITLGGSYLIDSLRLNLGMAYTISDEPSKDGREYEYDVLSLRTGLGYSF